MQADSHVQILKIHNFPHVPDDFYHGKPHFHHVFRLLDRVSFIRVDETDYYVAIADCIDFVDTVLDAHFIEFCEEIP